MSSQWRHRKSRISHSPQYTGEHINHCSKGSKKSGMDNKALCVRVITADQGLKYIPIIVLTSSYAGEDIVHSCDNGTSSYIRKPITFNQLVEVVKAISGYWFSIVEFPTGE